MAEFFARKPSRLNALSRLDARYFAIAVAELCVARIRHGATPTAAIVQGLRARQLRAMGARGPDDGDVGLARVGVERVAWAISAAAARVPWRADCLLRVMAAEHWLRRRGRKPDFFLGVVRPSGAGFAAHAWLDCDGVRVNGGDTAQYAVLVEPPALNAG